MQCFWWSLHPPLEAGFVGAPSNLQARGKSWQCLSLITIEIGSGLDYQSGWQPEHWADWCRSSGCQSMLFRYEWISRVFFVTERFQVRLGGAKNSFVSFNDMNVLWSLILIWGFVMRDLCLSVFVLLVNSVLVLQNVFCQGLYDRPYGEPHQSRSTVISTHGMVATSHPLAASVGLDRRETAL